MNVAITQDSGSTKISARHNININSNIQLSTLKNLTAPCIKDLLNLSKEHPGTKRALQVTKNTIETHTAGTMDQLVGSLSEALSISNEP